MTSEQEKELVNHNILDTLSLAAALAYIVENTN